MNLGLRMKKKEKLCVSIPLSLQNLLAWFQRKQGTSSCFGSITPTWTPRNCSLWLDLMLLECLWLKFSQVLVSEGNIVAARSWSDHSYLSGAEGTDCKIILKCTLTDNMQGWNIPIISCLKLPVLLVWLTEITGLQKNPGSEVFICHNYESQPVLLYCQCVWHRRRSAVCLWGFNMSTTWEMWEAGGRDRCR